MVSAQEAFEMATIRGARALHLEVQIGSLEVGKRADVVLLEMEPINQIPISSIYSALVYATKIGVCSSRFANPPAFPICWSNVTLAALWCCVCAMIC